MLRQEVEGLASVLRGIAAHGKRGIELVPCPFCKKAFKEKLELAVHVIRKH
jgi:uncharacterized C2H2 Zn-finger protein